MGCGSLLILNPSARTATLRRDLVGQVPRRREYVPVADG